MGSWAQLSWAKATTVGRIIITNPTSSSFGVTVGTLTLSDRTTVNVATLPAPGTSLTLSFTPRLTTSLRITVTAVNGMVASSALAGLQVYAS